MSYTGFGGRYPGTPGFGGSSFGGNGYPTDGRGLPGGGSGGGNKNWKDFIIPAIAVLVGAGSSYLKSKAAGKSVEEQNALYNQWLLDRQKGVTGLIDKLSGAGFNPFGPQVSTSSGKSLSTSVQNLLTQSSTKPVITPDYKKLEGQTKGVLESRLARPDALPPGYIERSVADINKAHAGGAAAARNAAARKGLSGEQAFALAAPMESARAGNIGDFLATVPLKERELQNQDVELAADLTRSFGLGSESTSRTSGTTTTAGSNSSTLTSPPNIGALAGLLLPPPPGPGSQTGMSNVGEGGGEFAKFLAWLYMQGAFGGNKPQGT
jgi:hypothetical protein